MADCPRCEIKLGTEEYEGVKTSFCNQCWGHWMSREEFTHVLKSERYRFSDTEKESLLRSWAEKSQPDVELEPVVNCPVCKKPTERKAFSADCSVALDLCSDHGVWLDSSEIKQVQVYFDSLE